MNDDDVEPLAPYMMTTLIMVLFFLIGMALPVQDIHPPTPSERDMGTIGSTIGATEGVTT